MRRVASVIDTWFDSGSMPWAQYHYPFENEEIFKERFPADFICEAIDQTRGWFYTLLAESVLALRHLELPQRGLPRPDPRPRGPEDVEEPRQRGRALGRDRPPRRRRLPLVLLRLPAALGGLPLLRRHRRGCGPPLPADALEHLLVLGALRERRGLRDRRAACRRPCGLREAGPRAQPASSIAGRSPACSARSPRSGSRWTSFDCTHGRSRDRRLQRGALQLVRAAQPPALLGRGRGGVRHPAASACSHWPRCWRHSLPSSPTRSTRTCAAGDRRGRFEDGRPGLGPPLRLPQGRRGADRRAARGRDGRGSPHGGARPGGPRPGQGQAAPAAAQGGGGRLRRRARCDRAPRRGGRLRAQRQGARLRPDARPSSSPIA